MFITLIEKEAVRTFSASSIIEKGNTLFVQSFKFYQDYVDMFFFNILVVIQQNFFMYIQM